MTPQRLKAKVKLDSEIFNMVIIVHAPKEPAQRIIQHIYNILQRKGVLVNGA